MKLKSLVRLSLSPRDVDQILKVPRKNVREPSRYYAEDPNVSPTFIIINKK